MPDKMNEHDLDHVAGGAKDASGREIVTQDKNCDHGRTAPYVLVSYDMETGVSTEQTFPLKCGECDLMTTEDGVCYCNYTIEK